MLKLENITKNYTVAGQVVPALKGLSIQFRKAEFVSILGPSGCGKTTTMNIVGGLDKYSSGDLIVDDISTKRYKDADWDNYRNKRVGFVFQAYNLIPHLSVLGNVELALTIAGISAAQRKARATKALNSVGLQEHLYKRPNQLSGGQMQRVAIARAIVNSPEILLMDEPTGALDTKTSQQIMELVKEISKDKLVIMVTHNPELAEQYSTRIVKLRDGELMSDSNPYSDRQDQVAPKSVSKTKKKSSMSFFTALGLSLRNLLTKKKRGIMTSVASAIGIIGIGLVLAMTTGLNTYIETVTRASAENAPITVTDGAGQVIDSNPFARDDIDVNLTVNPRERVQLSKNKPVIDYINGLDKNLFNEVSYDTGITLPVFSFVSGNNINSWIQIGNVNDSLALSLGAAFGGGAPISRAPYNMQFVKNQYDLIYGSWADGDKDKAVLVLNTDGTINDSLLLQLGVGETNNLLTGKIDSEVILSHKFAIPTNNQRFRSRTSNDSAGVNPFLVDDGQWQQINPNEQEPVRPITPEVPVLQTIQISGIVQLKEGRDSGVLQQGLVLTAQLFDYMRQQNSTSDIVEWMNLHSNIDDPLYNLRPISTQTNDNTPGANNYYIEGSGSVMSGNNFYVVKNTVDYLRDLQYRYFGGSDTPYEISLFAKDYASKTSIQDAIKKYNNGKELQDQIFFVDMVELIAGMLSSIIRIISIVLIGFTSISLIVTAVMIAILTSISVLERTKEIGILRSIGARKKDVNRLFNAENVILGLVSGSIGVVATFLFAVAISAILSATVGVSGIASVAWWHVLVLLGVSTLITLASGYLPSRAAAKKDPVLALRSE